MLDFMVNGHLRELKYEINSDMCYLIGVLFGDGNISKNRLRFAVKDYYFATKIGHTIKRLFKIVLIPKKIENNGSYLYQVNLNSSIISNKIKKSLDIIDGLTDEILLSNYLSGAFDSEGCVDKNRYRIRWVNKNKKYSDVTHNSLNKLGIIHKYRYKHKCFIIDICGFDNIYNFSKFVEFSVRKRKMRMLNLLKKSWEHSIKYQSYTILKNRISIKELEKLVKAGKV